MSLPLVSDAHTARDDRGAAVAVGRANRGAPTVPKLPSPAVGIGTSAASVGAKLDCDPNFYFDEQGRKHFKPECWSSAPAQAVGSAAVKTNCDPNFYLDDQGRKHFKAECFLIQGR